VRAVQRALRSHRPCVAVYEARAGGDDFAIIDFNRAADVSRGPSRRKAKSHRWESASEAVSSGRDFGLFRRDSTRVGGRGNRVPPDADTGPAIRRLERELVFRLPSGETVASMKTSPAKARRGRRFRRVEACTTQSWTRSRMPVPSPTGRQLALVSRHLASCTGTRTAGVDREERPGVDRPEDASTLQMRRERSDGTMMGHRAIRVPPPTEDGLAVLGELRESCCSPWWYPPLFPPWYGI